ncbi:MAG: hypothetical protein LC101_01900 [Flavobacteriales bacterium]|nr:hypothetical protein [Flavobacteriales bacterium]
MLKKPVIAFIFMIMAGCLSQFYIVQDITITNEQLDFMEEQICQIGGMENFIYSDKAREAYLHIGGISPFRWAIYSIWRGDSRYGCAGPYCRCYYQQSG